MTAGAASTSTATIDVIKVEAGDKVDVTAVVATQASFDTLAAATTSGNFTLTLTAQMHCKLLVYTMQLPIPSRIRRPRWKRCDGIFRRNRHRDDGYGLSDLQGVTAVTDFENGIFTI